MTTTSSPKKDIQIMTNYIKYDHYLPNSKKNVTQYHRKNTRVSMSKLLLIKVIKKICEYYEVEIVIIFLFDRS